MNTDFKEIEKKLIAGGWKPERTCGSQCLYFKSDGSSFVGIPCRRGRSLSICIIENLEQVTGLSLKR